MSRNLPDDEDGEQEESLDDSLDASDEASPASDVSTTPAATRAQSLSPSQVKSASKSKKAVSPVKHLPCADKLVDQMRKAAGTDGFAGLGDPALRRLLQVHPAFSQLLAKSSDMRGIVERGAEAILDLGNAECSGRAVTAQVLWTICGCVWRAVSVVVGGSCGRLPADAAPLDAQLRHLQQVNDDLRTRLTTCRRDYLRELTELRERCRQLEPPVAEALESLLREEPVMFFEPLDFVFDGVTKDFVRDTVEEKLRLLMLKGWRKGGDDDDDVGALTERIKELELEVERLRNEATTVRCLTCQFNAFNDGAAEDELQESAMAGEEHHEEPDGFVGHDAVEQDTEDARPNDEFMELESELAVDLQCQATQTHEYWESRRSRSSRGSSTNGGYAAAAQTVSALVSSQCRPATASGSPQEADHLSEQHQLQRKYRLLQRKFARFIERLKGRVDEEVIDEALSHVGLERPRTKVAERPRRAGAAFDRLYADAQRRVQRIRERTREVHDLQVEELERCSGVLKGSGAKKKVEQLRGLHSKTVVCAEAFHDALENFHFDVARTAIVEACDERESMTSAPPTRDGRVTSSGDICSEDVAPPETPSAVQFTPVRQSWRVRPDSRANSRGTSCGTSDNNSPQKPRKLDSSQMHALRSAFQNCGSRPDKMCKQASSDAMPLEAARHPRECSGSAHKSMLSRSPQEATDASSPAELPNEIQVLAEKLKHDRKFKAFGADSASSSTPAGVTALPKSRHGFGRSRHDLGVSRSLPSLPRFGSGRGGCSNVGGGHNANVPGVAARPSHGAVHNLSSTGARRSSSAAAVFGSTGKLVSEPRPWTTPSSSCYAL